MYNMVYCFICELLTVPVIPYPRNNEDLRIEQPCHLQHRFLGLGNFCWICRLGFLLGRDFRSNQHLEHRQIERIDRLYVGRSH